MLIKRTNVPTILFIKGIFKKDCTSDDIFEKKILESTIELDTTTNDTVTDNFVNYEQLPNIFTDIESWKKKTNLHCWNCTLQFTSIPVFIPKVIEPVTIKNKIEREKTTGQKFSISVYGVFCSFGCAQQHIEVYLHSVSEKIETLNKLRLLYKLFYNEKMRELPYYPSRFSMKQYGGDLSTNEFKEELTRFNSVSV
jgi:hypothetical protein